jgi:pimeloyl-ACP methyl ester carboxylesterase
MAEHISEHGLWYADVGAGDPLVLLHPGGAGVDSRALTPQVEAFASRFRVCTAEQRGHGRTADAPGPLSYEQMAADTIGFAEGIIGGPALLLGVSDGAVVALTVALRRPGLVRRLVLAAGVFHRDGWHEGVLDGEPPGFLKASYAELSPDGAGHYPVVAAKLGLQEVPRVPGTKAKQNPGRMLLECLRDREADVLRFLSDLQIPPTSNQAERDLRPAKTQQKISGRLRSEKAARDRYAIRGYASTAAKHGASALAALRDALAGNAWMPPLPEIA